MTAATRTGREGGGEAGNAPSRKSGPDEERESGYLIIAYMDVKVGTGDVGAMEATGMTIVDTYKMGMNAVDEEEEEFIAEPKTCIGRWAPVTEAAAD